MLVAIDQLDESAKRYHSYKKLAPPKHKPVAAEESAALPADATNPQQLIKRKEMLEAVSSEPVDFAYERAIGKNDSVYSNFCELISTAKQKICRVVIKDGNKNTGFATGFMVSERLMLTNWHVFQTEADVGDSEVEFNYELDMSGHGNMPAIFKVKSKDFFSSNKELDYCLVAVEPLDITGKIPLSTFGYLYLDPATGKVGKEGKELLNIIHHPDGDYKQLSIRENRFTKMLTNTIWYETDTAPGSSGSPVFNDQWQVVALHHMGVPSKTADGLNYLDRNGKIIGPVGGKIDISQICWIANEGIRISVLLDDVFKNHSGSVYIDGLRNPNKKPADIQPLAPQPESTNDNPKPETMDNSNTDNIRISIPASLLQQSNNFSVTFNRSQNNESATTGAMQPPAKQAADEDFLTEKAKIDIENAVDYSHCKGYLSSFLSVHIPMIQPKKELSKFVAKLKNSDSFILKYFHFSTIFHSVRCVPMVSGINVDGNSKNRLDTSKRVDVWLRDSRVDYDVQLDDKFYSLSGFDKGHMSRREDADWGATPELAKQYADLTCVYTNACPQVPTLNRSNRQGLWGKLENLILEKGIENEDGVSSKISVFNGPIFADTDPVFKGIQIPLAFWKLILWFNAKGKLQATAFKLSQSGLVGDINFEELDFDADAEFQQYHCSIASLEQLTGLDFSHVLQYDTFKAGGKAEPIKINSEEEFKDFIDDKFGKK